MSTADLLSPRVWRVLLALWWGVVGGAMLTAVALLAGAADPLRAPHLVASYDPASDLRFHSFDAGNWLGASLGSVRGVFTIEAESAASRAWGLDVAGVWLLVRADGYFSAQPAQMPPQWMPFVHIDTGSNRLSLHVDGVGQAVLRINDEVAWSAAWPASRGYMPALIYQGVMPPARVRLYGSGR